MIQEKAKEFWEQKGKPFLKQHWLVISIAVVAFLLGMGVSQKVRADQPACENYAKNVGTGKVMCFKSEAYVAPYRVYQRATDDEIDKHSASVFTFHRLPFRHYNGISDNGVADFGREPYRPDSSPGRDGLRAGVTTYIRPLAPRTGLSLRQEAGSPVVQVIRQ